MSGKPDIFENEEQQKRLCAILGKVCLYSTIGVMAYLILAIWLDGVFPKETTGKIFSTYAVIIVGSYIIRRIFVDSYKRVETVSTKTVTTRREDPIV